MFYRNTKKSALNEHESAVMEYNSTYQSLENMCGTLYKNRTSTISVARNIEELINSIANTPKTFEVHLSTIKTNKENFKKTEDYAKDAINTLKKSSASTVAGVAGGAAVAGMAPTAAIWVATTFGTASTGAAISTLSGAAATNAALAWLGGGALAAGGGGMAAGNALLALAGPIGWGIAGVSAATSIFAVSKKNKKIAEEATYEAKKVRKSRGVISEQVAKVRNINAKTESLLTKIKQSFSDLKNLNGQDYSQMTEEQQLALGTLVNNTVSLTALMNETV